MRTAILTACILLSARPGCCFIKNNGGRSATARLPFSLDATSYTPAELKKKYAALKPCLPKDMDAVKCGGYYNLQMLSANPKETLVDLIVNKLKNAESTSKPSNDDQKIEALATLLYAQAKGFSADLVDGQWAAVLSRQGSKSPKFQKIVSRGGDSSGLALNTFDINSMTFDGYVKVLKKGLVYSKVKYTPLSDAYSTTTDGKIVLRRIGCDIVKATFKFWKLPTLSLPFLKKKGGYLEFVYLDKDIRITRGNKGGLFVHFRPAFLLEKLEQ
eukprot:scaffold25830_cov162-Cylindrotheca_fusiformis.AAC.15